MEITSVAPDEKAIWNAFVSRHYPPVGAFMQSWEWGSFQEALGRKIERYFLKNGNEHIGAFTLVHHPGPLYLSYGYMPRGPVIARHITDRSSLVEIFNTIKQWAKENYPHLAFIRLEPPMGSLTEEVKPDLKIPSYYVQPKFNLSVPLNVSLEEIMGSFHSSTRSNIRRAEKRGVTVEMKSNLAQLDLEEFFRMAQDTITRNSGKNVYPTPAYFRSLFATIPFAPEKDDTNNLSIGAFCGYQYNKPAAMHFVLFFCGTATYLYGASYSRHLHSKATTYLHWVTMQEAKRRGLQYYDIGGIDEARWPTLTSFKRQFRGEEFSYIGNVDIPIRPGLYRLYNIIRRFKK